MRILYIAFCTCLLLSSAGYSQTNVGCFFSNASSTDGNVKIVGLPSSGNPALDRFLTTDITVLKTFFNVTPPTFYFQDNNNPNAYYNSDNNTIYLGFNLINNEYFKTRNLTTIPIILAHEFGHCVDYNNKAILYPGMNAELFADYLAGVFMKYRSSVTWTDLNGSLTSFFSMGDNLDFIDPKHHGTGTQRLNAIRTGYTWYQQHPNATVSDMITAAKQYLNIPIQGSKTPVPTTTTSHTKTVLRNSITLFTKPVITSSSNGLCRYKYIVSVTNTNNFPVQVTIGGFYYGHYLNCDGRPENFVRDDDFVTEDATIEANSTANVEVEAILKESPGFCTGVRPSERGRLISVAAAQ